MLLSDAPTSTSEQTCGMVRYNSITPEAKFISTEQTGTDLNNEDTYLSSDPKIICSISLDMIDEQEESVFTISGLEVSCSICLEVADEEEGNLFAVPGCNHIFHVQCIAQWKKESNKCPICRGPLPKELSPALSTPNYFPVEEDIPNITQCGMLENLMLCVLWIVYPLCLVLLVLILEAAPFAFSVVLVFFIMVYYLFQTEDFLYASFLVIMVCLIYPVVIFCLLVGFIVRTFYMLYRTMKFYV